MLYIFGGLPGSGKTTISRLLAERLKAVHIRIDTIEQALRDAGAWVDGPAGYQMALENLRLGRDVVADSVNPLTVTRQAWRDVAKRAGIPVGKLRCSARTPQFIASGWSRALVISRGW